MATSRISELSMSILTSTGKIDTYLQRKGLPTISFNALGPGRYGTIPVSPDIEETRVGAVKAVTELLELLQGPSISLKPTFNGASLQAISRWDIANKVPSEGHISFADLAKQCSDISELDLCRLLRYAMVHHRLFHEPRPGAVAHSAYSRLLVQEPLLADMFWLFADSGFSAFPYIVDALERFKDHEPSHTAWSLASGINKGFFESLAQQPELATRFSRAMAALSSFPLGPFSVPEAPESNNPVLHYPWSRMGEGLVVDIGGSSGMDAFLLAKAFPNLRFVVQDLPEAIAGAEASIPEELHGRVSFMSYSFFTPQPCTADIYMIKMCFHNWPDHYCVKILRNQIPALRSGARFVIIDGLLPKRGATSFLAERSARFLDMMMLTKVNGREREAEDWIRIFKQADERFQVLSVKAAGTLSELKHAFGIIDVVFDRPKN